MKGSEPDMVRLQTRSRRFAALLVAVAATMVAAVPSFAGTPATVTFAGVIKDTFGQIGRAHV